MRPLLYLLLCPVAALASASTMQVPLRGAIPAAASTTAQTPVLTALRDAERRRIDAIASNDVDTLRNVIATDYYHVETNGRVRTRSEFLQLVARDEFEFRSYSIVSMEIQLLDSGRTAIIRGRFQAEMRPTSRTSEFRGRYVRVWQLQADGWRNTMMQSTEIKPGR